jgi:ferredoxin
MAVQSKQPTLESPPDLLSEELSIQPAYNGPMGLLSGNLLKHRWVAATLRSRLFPGLLQWITLVVFVVVIWQLILGPSSAHDNFGTALTWVLWWPLIPIIFLAVGRFWCAICPFATVSDAVQRFVGNHRPVPGFLKRYGIWIIDALFILITWADHVFGIVESPWGSGMLLLFLTTGVIVSGAFFQRRMWCRYLCFLGGMAGNYARMGMVALRVKPEVCKTCTAAAACFNGTATSAPCPLFEFPRTLVSNANCNLCANCVKSCPNDAITLTLRAPSQELWFIRNPHLPEAFLAVVIMGIVFVQNITMLEFWQDILHRLELLVGTSSYVVTFTISFLIAMAIPVILLFLTAAFAGRANRESVLKNFTRFGYALIPLDVAGHVAHNLFHLFAEGKAVWYTFLPFLGYMQPEGSTALLDPGTIQMLQYTLIIVGTAGSLYTAYRIARSAYSLQTGMRTLLPYAALLLLFGVVNVALFVLPMSHRV